MERLPPREAISPFFDEVVARSLADDQHKRCMLVNLIFASPLPAEAMQASVVDVLKQIEAYFPRRVEAGQTDGDITLAESPDDLARVLLGTLVGIHVLARVRPEQDLLEGFVRPIAKLLVGATGHPADAVTLDDRAAERRRHRRRVRLAERQVEPDD